MDLLLVFASFGSETILYETSRNSFFFIAPEQYRMGTAIQ